MCGDFRACGFGACSKGAQGLHATEEPPPMTQYPRYQFLLNPGEQLQTAAPAFSATAIEPRW